MSINIRDKGANGERELATILNGIITDALTAAGMPLPSKPIVQRNQNQTAVGGKDLVGTYDIAIEVKRQEQLSINTWWKQCVASAETRGERPVLIYRQNRMKWSVVMYGGLLLPGVHGGGAAMMTARVEISFNDFKIWFRHYVDRKIQNGEYQYDPR